MQNLQQVNAQNFEQNFHRFAGIVLGKIESQPPMSGNYINDCIRYFQQFR